MPVPLWTLISFQLVSMGVNPEYWVVLPLTVTYSALSVISISGRWSMLS